MAARKRVDPVAAKAARQKKMAIVLGVVFLAVAGLQGPKTVKMLQGPQPVEPAAATTAATTAAPATAPATAAPPAAPAAPAAGAAPAEQPPAQLVASDAAPVPGEGQLVSFEQFASKDPFAQQVPGASGSGAASGGSGSSSAAAGGGKRAGGKGAGPASASGDGSGGSIVPPATTAPAAPTPPAVTTPAPMPTVPQATETAIAVNGVVTGALQPDSTFPAADPIFVLVRLGADGKSVEIGIAGGSYANGEDTIRLELGKPLTLQNTSDGARYELKLVSVAPRAG